MRGGSPVSEGLLDKSELTCIHRSPPSADHEYGVADTSHVSGDVSDDSGAGASDEQALQEASAPAGVFCRTTGT